MALVVSPMLLPAAAAAPATQPAERQFIFTVFSAEPISGLCYEPQPGAAPVALAFYPTARSPRYAYRGPARIRFFHAETGEVMAELTMPPGTRTALFILSPDDSKESGAGRYRLHLVDDSLSRQGSGTLMVLNFSDLELAGTINQRRITLGEGFSDPIRVGWTAKIELRTPSNGRSYHAYAETILLGKAGRGLLLLLPPYRRGSLEVQSRVLIDEPGSGGGPSADGTPVDRK